MRDFMKYFYKDIKKENNIILRGVLNTGDDFDQSKTYPTVIYFHGFADDRNGLQFMNIQNSKFLTANGYIVFRFDFSGCGESDGSFFDINLSREVEEARLIHEFVINEPYVDKENLFWKGHSMGGSVAVAIAHEKKPKALSLFSPAADFSEKENSLMKSLKEAFRSSYVKKEGDDVGGLKISDEFIKDVTSYDLYGLAQKYQGPVQIIRGDEDKIISKESNEKLCKSFENCMYKEIKGTDHTFSDFDQRLESFQLMFDFFEKYRN